jgi:hypothetical protein
MSNWRTLALLLGLALGACAPAGRDAPPLPPVPPALPSTPISAPTSGEALPPAVDGSNLDACQDGQCEVSVTAPVEFVVHGVRTSVTVHVDRVTLQQSDSSGSSSTVTVSGPNGTSTVSGPEGQLTVRLKGVSGNTVVLDISSS